ncbi:MAG: hypothetical protein CL995_02680 [Euryarchaeota archaeon]|jgi:phosphatidylserine/phosphatidylglycerophosphate/cardiolipin synthase-like enzyme|nr:hypothetical protein [Euryarchaeota archaeon]
MSMPRRAMEQMGFSICCLTCDAPDVTGSSRCRSCIAAHTRARDRMSGQATSKADRLSRELVTMLASPAKYIDDTEHGELMLHYVTLISQHQGTVSAKTQEEVEEMFRRQRRHKKASLLDKRRRKTSWWGTKLQPDEMEELLSLIDGGKRKEVPTWDALLEEVGEMLDED